MSERSSILILGNNVEEIMQLSAYMEGSYDICGLEEDEDCIDGALSSSADLILVDDMLVDPNCYELCQLLKRNPSTAEIPIILMSDLSEQELEQELDSVASDDFICKPLNKTELIEKIETLLSFKQIH